MVGLMYPILDVATSREAELIREKSSVCYFKFVNAYWNRKLVVFVPPDLDEDHCLRTLSMSRWRKWSLQLLWWGKGSLPLLCYDHYLSCDVDMDTIFYDEEGIPIFVMMRKRIIIFFVRPRQGSLSELLWEAGLLSLFYVITILLRGEGSLCLWWYEERWLFRCRECIVKKDTHP
jgi:hypothetical protein